MASRATRRNPQDATRRNVQAANKRLARLKERVDTWTEFNASFGWRLNQIEQRFQKIEDAVERLQAKARPR